MSAVEEHDTVTELETLGEALHAGAKQRERDEQRAPAGFDPAALFLLDQQWQNLFDPADPDGVWFSCKGCRDRVRFSDRQKHFKAHKRSAARSPKGGGSRYRATRTAGDPATHNKEESTMASATRTRSTTRSGRGSRNLGADGRTAPKSGAAKTGAAKTGSAKSGAAKKTTAAKSNKSRAEAGKIVAAAAAELKGKAPMTAGDLAALVCKKNASMKPFNVAFAIRAAARKGETFKKSADRPALFSLKG